MKQIIAACRNFLWCATDQYNHSPSVSWEKLCQGKKEGGLGIIDPIAWNIAAIGKYVWWLASKQDHLWIKWVHCTYLKQQEWWGYSPPITSSWSWRKICAVKETFKQAYCGNGWLNHDGKYTIQKGYEWIKGTQARVKWNALVWNKISPPAHCFLAWMTMLERLKTRDRLIRMNVCVTDLCLLCANNVETHEHLFFGCCFSTQCVDLAGKWLGIALPIRELEQWWCSRNGDMMKKKIGASVMVSLMAHIWYARNTCREEGYVIRPLELIRRVKKEIIVRIKYVMLANVSMRNHPWLATVLV